MDHTITVHVLCMYFDCILGCGFEIEISDNGFWGLKVGPGVIIYLWYKFGVPCYHNNLSIFFRFLDPAEFVCNV